MGFICLYSVLLLYNILNLHLNHVLDLVVLLFAAHAQSSVSYSCRCIIGVHCALPVNIFNTFLNKDWLSTEEIKGHCDCHIVTDICWISVLEFGMGKALVMHEYPAWFLWSCNGTKSSSYNVMKMHIRKSWSHMYSQIYYVLICLHQDLVCWLKFIPSLPYFTNLKHKVSNISNCISWSCMN